MIGKTMSRLFLCVLLGSAFTTSSWSGDKSEKTTIKESISKYAGKGFKKGAVPGRKLLDKGLRDQSLTKAAAGGVTIGVGGLAGGAAGGAYGLAKGTTKAAQRAGKAATNKIPNPFSKKSDESKGKSVP